MRPTISVNHIEVVGAGAAEARLMAHGPRPGGGVADSLAEAQAA